MVELIAGPIVMALGAVIVLMGVVGRTPRLPAHQLGRGTGAVLHTMTKVTSAAADLGNKTRLGIGGSLSAPKQPERDAVAIAEDTMAALLSELLTLREEVDGLRNQIEASQKPVVRKAPARAASKPARRFATARSA